MRQKNPSLLPMSMSSKSTKKKLLFNQKPLNLQFTDLGIFGHWVMIATILLLMTSCKSGQSEQHLLGSHASTINSRPITKNHYSGQNGPNSTLLQSNSTDFVLQARRRNNITASHNGHWVVELFKGNQRLAQWPAVSGLRHKQDSDRLWSPGNGAPLPIGAYTVGQPEPWGADLWIHLEPMFSTARSGLGIHQCNPGTGCICIPSRKDLESIADWVKAAEIIQLTVIN